MSTRGAIQSQINSLQNQLMERRSHGNFLSSELDEIRRGLREINQVLSESEMCMRRLMMLDCEDPSFWRGKVQKKCEEMYKNCIDSSKSYDQMLLFMEEDLREVEIRMENEIALNEGLISSLTGQIANLQRTLNSLPI